MRANPGRCDFGPCWPYADTRSITSFGLMASSSSNPSPHFSSVPGRKFSTTTSARATMRRKIALPSSCFRSSVMQRLLRASLNHQYVSPASLSVPSLRR